MPPRTSVRTFITALQTGRTTATTGLDRLFTNPGYLSDREWYGQLDTAGALNGTLTAAMREDLRTVGELDEDHVDHIASWPDAAKDALRPVFKRAIDENRNIRFFWELHGGETSINAIDNLDGGGDIIVTFRSPRRGVALAASAATAATEEYDVQVEIESEGPAA
jgi:hypothetical protein